MSYNFISSFFGGSGSSDWMSGLYSNLSEYNSIRSGNYYQLTKKYFSEFGSSQSVSKNSNGISNTYDVLEQIRSKYTKSADEASDTSSANSTDKASSTRTKYEQEKITNNRNAAAASTNLTSSLNTLMNKKTYETSDTNTEDKVKESVATAVDKFANSYNGMIDASKKSTASGVATNTKYLMNLTDRYKSQLGSIGINVDDNGKMTVNKDTLKNADTDTIKNLFTNGGGYGSGASTYSSLIGYYASSAVSNGTYTSSGSYASTGSSDYNTTV